MSRMYDYRSLIGAYIFARRRDYPHPDFANYYQGLVGALESRFHLVLSFDSIRNKENQALWMLFQSAVDSYLQLRSPGEGFQDAALVERNLDRIPEGTLIRHQMGVVSQLTDANKAAHLELLQSLFKALYGEIPITVTSEELFARGFDDSKEPQWKDYIDYR